MATARGRSAERSADGVKPNSGMKRRVNGGHGTSREITHLMVTSSAAWEALIQDMNLIVVTGIIGGHGG